MENDALSNFTQQRRRAMLAIVTQHTTAQRRDRCSKSLANLNIGRWLPLMHLSLRDFVHQRLYPIARHASHESRRYIAADR